VLNINSTIPIMRTPSEAGLKVSPTGPEKRCRPRMTTISLPPVKRVALYQLAILLPVCVVLLFWSSVLAYSVLIGGLIQIFPQAWFTRQAYRYAGARKVQSIVRAMYWGETGKIVLTTVLFTVSFIMVKPLSISALFSSFVVMILVQYLAVMVLLKH
jgi:ATP synthase protein I